MLKIKNEGTSDYESWTVTDEKGNYITDSFTLMGAIQQAGLYLLQELGETKIEIDLSNSALL